MTKYSPLTVESYSSFDFSDSSYQVTLSIPVEKSNEFDCKILHKKCWSCDIIDQEVVKISQGISVREFYPHPTKNQCVDCARAAAALDETEESEDDYNSNSYLAEKGVPFRCTLQCVRNKNADL